MNLKAKFIFKIRNSLIFIHILILQTIPIFITEVLGTGTADNKTAQKL